MYRHTRDEMLRTIEQEAAMIGVMTGRGAVSSRVMRAMADVPRERFVPEHLRVDSYGNFPLPIGNGQTISQQFIVALMTDLLETRPEHKVLEVGTGSGYQAAVLSQLVEQVYSLERISTLAAAARHLLEAFGYFNVEVCDGDGYQGLLEHAPYDGIIVTAAAPDIPPALLTQLKPGGRMVIPVGQPYSHQELVVVKKHSSGKDQRESVLDVAFVPMVQGG
ncbi:MAG: protein-L-isoaspartate O-methyltransferase [Desulfuromonas sp.]|nr:MAG: protein-L-isoaspartate O-methyltransferase [Desulfuromonas sp.]